MRQIEELQNHWRSSVSLRGLQASMTLKRDALVLGADTVLAKRRNDGEIALDGAEARVLTLLAAAYGRPVDPRVLAALRKASAHARRGDECMAAMHVALALPALRDAADSARRLFIADGLMKDGVEPQDIWTALAFDGAPLEALSKLYNPGQPRVPAGSGRASGQWTSEDSTSDTEARAPIGARIATQAAGEAADSAATTRWLQWLLEAGERSAGPLAFIGALLYSTPAGGERREGEVPDQPGFRWTEDEGLLTVTRESDGEIVLQAKRDPDGTYRALPPPGTRRLLGEHYMVDPANLPADDPRSTQRDDEPRLCPEPPKPDAPQGSANSWAYSDFVKATINEPPTPPKFGYRLRNPFDGGKEVKYDDCERATGTMVEIKGHGYARLLRNDNIRAKIEDQWLGQATRQIEASEKRPVRWYFAELPAMQFAQDIFRRHGILTRIKLIYLPPPGGNP